MPLRVSGKNLDIGESLRRHVVEKVEAVVARYFDEESRFVEAVNRGEEALERGEYLTHEQVGHRLQRFLRP